MNTSPSPAALLQILPFILLPAFFLRAQKVDFILSGNVAEAKAKAKESGKMLFVDIYTNWCPPCKVMDQEYFTDPEIAGRLNAFFVNLKADAEGNGRAAARQFAVVGYPTMVFLASDGTMIRAISGAPSNKLGFLLLINSILGTTEAGAVFLSLEKVWAGNRQDAEIADAYFSLRSRYNMSNNALLEEYLDDLPADSLDLPGVKKTISRHAAALDGAPYQYLLARKQDPRCANALKRIVDTNFKKAVAEKNEKHLNKVLDAVAAQLPDPEQRIHRQAALKMQFYLDTGRPDRFHSTASEYIPNHLLPAAETGQDSVRLQQYSLTLENIAWQYSEYVGKKSHLSQALVWFNQCPEKVTSADFLRYREAIDRKAGK